MTTLPTPAEALERSLSAFDLGDRDAARYWLAVAAELRAGNPPQPVRHVFDGANLLAAGEELEQHAQRAAPMVTQRMVDDATAVMSAVHGNECPSCGGEIITHEGRTIHRSTYAAECEFATVGR